MLVILTNVIILQTRNSGSSHRTGSWVKVNLVPDCLRSPFFSAVIIRILNELLNSFLILEKESCKIETGRKDCQKYSVRDKDKVQKFPDPATFLTTFEGQNPGIKA